MTTSILPPADRRRRSSGQPLPLPPEEFSPEEVLAEELRKLTFTERAEIEEEVHGVRCGAAEETPELVERSLREFDTILNSQKESEPDNHLLRNIVRTSLLDETEAKAAGSKCYLNDPDVRLRFLRCETFCVKEAVQRLIKFLEFSRELFGDYIADRPMRLSDFTREEEKILQNSRTQPLPFRDRSGRRVFVSVGGCNFDLSLQLRYKIMMYMHWVVSEDIETQRKGYVAVVWMFDEDERPNTFQNLWQKLRKKHKTFDTAYNGSRPTRLCSFHFFVPQNSPFLRTMANIYSFTKRPEERKRFKPFFGEPIEFLYALNGFGISSDLIPVSSANKVKTTNQQDWVHVQRAKERQQDKSNGEEIIECPRSQDVVVRKGQRYRNNPGNLRYRALIERLADKHQAAAKDEKYEITMRIVQEIEGSDGRFLDWTRKMWIVSKDRNKNRNKVASAIKPIESIENYCSRSRYESASVRRQLRRSENGHSQEGSRGFPRFEPFRL